MRGSSTCLGRLFFAQPQGTFLPLSVGICPSIFIFQRTLIGAFITRSTANCGDKVPLGRGGDRIRRKMKSGLPHLWASHIPRCSPLVVVDESCSVGSRILKVCAHYRSYF